mmetsp:Transcript_12995/g.30768  ORF Transcript_12995/g.30768 Transcript_12995/m.30768 type:complete len:108 (-) Transcript_12995:558-881(-)
MSEADSNKKPDDSVPKGYKRKKQVPPVSFLLKNGDPESADKPQSWMDVYGPPVMIMITFILSFFVFHYFIENHTTHKPITLPRMPRQMTEKTMRKATGDSPKRDSDL